jgi:hypothetical protein
MRRSDSISSSSSDGQWSLERPRASQTLGDGLNRLQSFRNWYQSVVRGFPDSASTSANPQDRGIAEREQLLDLGPREQLILHGDLHEWHYHINEVLDWERQHPGQRDHIMHEYRREPIDRWLSAQPTYQQILHWEGQGLGQFPLMLDEIDQLLRNRESQSRSRPLHQQPEQAIQASFDQPRSQQGLDRDLDQAIQASFDQPQLQSRVEEQKLAAGRLLDRDLSQVSDDIYTTACSIAISTIEDIDGEYIDNGSMERTRMMESIFMDRYLEEVRYADNNFKELVTLLKKIVFPHALDQAECEVGLRQLRDRQNQGESLSPEDNDLLQRLDRKYKQFIRYGKKIVQQQQIKSRIRQIWSVICGFGCTGDRRYLV